MPRVLIRRQAKQDRLFWLDRSNGIQVLAGKWIDCETRRARDCARASFSRDIHYREPRPRFSPFHVHPRDVGPDSRIIRKRSIGKIPYCCGTRRKVSWIINEPIEITLLRVLLTCRMINWQNETICVAEPCKTTSSTFFVKSEIFTDNWTW